jgi:CsoR family transcriptional regulator, copper-sensing transcriptional repressor
VTLSGLGLTNPPSIEGGHTLGGYSWIMAPNVAPGYIDDKASLERRLARIEGQVRGLRRMVDEEVYCIDVLTQIAAVERALDGVALKLLSDHTGHCVRDAVATGGTEADEKVDELMAAVERFARTR